MVINMVSAGLVIHIDDNNVLDAPYLLPHPPNFIKGELTYGEFYSLNHGNLASFIGAQFFSVIGAGTHPSLCCTQHSTVK